MTPAAAATSSIVTAAKPCSAKRACAMSSTCCSRSARGRRVRGPAGTAEGDGEGFALILVHITQI